MARKPKKTAAPPAPTVPQQITPPTVANPTDTPVRALDGQVLRQLGADLDKRFKQYVSDRLLTEQKWMRNLRQYLGIYDPDIEKMLSPNQSRAYPRLTRVKCISMLSRIMNLMFPGNEDNWELNAAPSPEMSPADVKQAVIDLQQKYQAQNQQPPPMSDDFINAAVQALADKRAEA